MDLKLFTLLLSFAGLFVQIHGYWKGVCTRSQSGQQEVEYREYVVQYYRESCGVFGWKRCTRSRVALVPVHTGYIRTYWVQRYCCPRFEGDPATGCHSTCTSANCFNGVCSHTAECDCNEGWTGSTCRDDANLHNWCNSVSDNNNIMNSYLNSVQSGVTVYCPDVSPITYVGSDTSAIAPLIKVDSDRSTYKKYLYEFWMGHPILQKYCCFDSTAAHLNNFLNQFESSELAQYVSGLKADIAIELRNELNTRCQSSNTVNYDAMFCATRFILNAIDAVNENSYEQWTSQEKSNYKKAILARFAILEQQNPNELSFIDFSAEEALADCANKIFELVKNRDIPQLLRFINFFPPNEQDTLTPCHSDNVCIFTKLIEQLRIYVASASQDSDPQLINGKKRLILNTAANYKVFLEQKQINQIAVNLARQDVTLLQISSDLQSQISTGFSTLRQYFQNIESFNQQITVADIGYVNGRLTDYTNSVADIVQKLKNNMGELLFQTLIAAGANVAESSVYLAMEIASAYNPLEVLTGGTSPKDVLQAAAHLANAIASLVRVTTIQTALSELHTKAQTLSEKFEQNSNFLQDVKVLIEKTSVSNEDFKESKARFLKLYSDYSPAVTLPELAEVGALWDNLLGATCDVLDGLDTAAAGVAKSIIYKAGYCDTLGADIDKMMSTYEEIYDYQFDLIDFMAVYVRSLAIVDSANGIQAEFTNINGGTSQATLRVMGVLTYIAYQADVLQAVYLYCNILEYKNGGRRPTQCRGANTDLSSLLAYNPPVCTSSTLRFYQIPVSPSGVHEDAQINITDLFAGKSVTFQVPSNDWLVQHSWIHSSEENYAFYVRQFQVFLPHKPSHPQAFISRAASSKDNELTPDSSTITEYILIPNPSLVYEYEVGPMGRLQCSSNKRMNNPYTTCETTDVSSVCEHSLVTTQDLYPSIYSQWTISVSGGEQITVPDPATDMTISVALQLCKLAPSLVAQQYDYSARYDDWYLREQENEHCCSPGQYRPSIVSNCEVCPANSDSALAGYYCEKN